MHEGISHTRAERCRERGTAGLEFAGLIAVAAAVVGALILGFSSGRFDEHVCEGVGEVVQSEGVQCATTDGPPRDDGDRGLRDWFCDTFGWFCEGDDEEPGGGDGGYDGDLPVGLPADHELVEILGSTERGREILQWLADNGVEVIFDPSATGAYYDPALNTIVMGPDNQGAGTFVHEYNHALYAATGQTVNGQATSVTREEYVNGMLDEETAGVVLAIVAVGEFSDAGHGATYLHEQTYWNAHDQGRQDALDAGLSQAEADAAARDAGFQAIRQLFVDGTLVTSTTNQTYEDYYGSHWDSVNP